jgi:PAS domain S-box-containing protein
MRARAFLAALLLSCPAAGASGEDRPWRILLVHGPDSTFPAVMVLDRSLEAAGVILENRPSSVLEDDRRLTLAAAAVIALLVGIVVALLVNRAERRRSEQALADLLRFERLVSELSATFVDVSPQRVNDEVERALRKVLEAMELDHCSLFVYLPEEGEARSTHAADVSGVPALERPVLYSEAPSVFDRLREGETVQLDDVASDLPVGAAGERRAAAERQVKSVLLIPITFSERLVRGISFLTTRRYRSWPADLVPRLRLVGEILVSAVVGKRAEAALRASEERYREVVESQTDLICRFLPDTTLTFVNEAYCRYFGRSREDLIGRPFLELIPEGPREAARMHVESLIENPRIVTREHEVLRPDGSIGWQQWRNYAVRGRDGRVVEFQAVGRDITDRKHAEEADRRLAQASRLALLGELAASIAHEINQPLGAILSNADALEMLLDSAKGEPEEIRTILSDIRREGIRASEVIRHVRSLVRWKAMEMHALDVNGVAREVLDLASRECRRRGVEIETDLASGLPEVRGDRVWLQQLLLNLILNGIDAISDLPPADRRLLLRTSGDGPSSVEVAVVDRGHGIPEDLLPRLFDSFVTTREQGMGLGLTISRSIVEAHGGKIRAENNPGRGATLRFTLPAAENGRAGRAEGEVS